MALSIAVEQDTQFRESLPTDYMNFMGIVHSADVSGRTYKIYTGLLLLFRMRIKEACLVKSLPT